MYGIIESRYGYSGIGFFLVNQNWMVFIGTGYGYNGIGLFSLTNSNEDYDYL